MERKNLYFDSLDSPFVHKVSPEEMSKILAEKIPLEDRLRSAYLSTILLDVVGVISKQLLEALKSMRSPATLQNSRNLRSAIQDYYDSNIKAMKPQLYFRIHQKSLRFFKKICRHLTIFEYSYSAAIMKARGGGKCADMALSICYVMKVILRYIIEFDREMDASIQKKLGPFIQYRAEDNVFCVEILRQVNLIVELLGGADTVENEHTALL